MNCIHHPDQPRVAFCQECGKPLCEACSRNVGGAVFCGPCLAARVSAPSGGPGYTYPAGAVPPPPSASPFLAGVLGFIPGVGAMYNGQFVKGLAHICIFAMLIVITTHVSPFGLLIAGWVFYMVFDAIYTARARRDGDPLPDPFGLLKLEGEMGMGRGQGAPVASPYQTPVADSQTAAPPVAGVGATTGPTPFYTPEFFPGSNVPVGAVVLIGLGVLFLLGSFNVFNFRLSHIAVPLFLIGLGVWLYFRNMNYGGVVDDGSGYFKAYAIRKLRGPAFLILTGVLWLLDSLHIMRWRQGWGFYLLIWGVLILAERMAGAEVDYVAPMPPTSTPSSAPATQEEMTAVGANPQNEAGDEFPLTHRKPEGQE